jgi:hypothetical protein
MFETRNGSEERLVEISRTGRWRGLERDCLDMEAFSLPCCNYVRASLAVSPYFAQYGHIRACLLLTRRRLAGEK